MRREFLDERNLEALAGRDRIAARQQGRGDARRDDGGGFSGERKAGRKQPQRQSRSTQETLAEMKPHDAVAIPDHPDPMPQSAFIRQ